MKELTIKEQLTNINNKSHAFLIKVNSNNDVKEIIDAIKILVCSSEEHVNCNTCYKIEQKKYLETIFLNNDENTIKKEDVLEVINRFSNHPIEGKKQVYMIENIHGVSTSVSNTLLKFLEEPPTDKIIAIFTTNNINKVLPTIKSRCQIIESLNPINNLFENMLIDYESYSEENLELLTSLGIKIVEEFEIKKEKIIIDIKKYLEESKNKVDNINLINIMIILYKSIIDFKLKEKQDYLINYKLFSKVSLHTLNNRINYLLDCIKWLELNANPNLFFNKIFIDMKELK